MPVGLFEQLLIDVGVGQAAFSSFDELIAPDLVELAGIGPAHVLAAPLATPCREASPSSARCRCGTSAREQTDSLPVRSAVRAGSCDHFTMHRDRVDTPIWGGRR
jgi:hypothetical protein